MKAKTLIWMLAACALAAVSGAASLPARELTLKNGYQRFLGYETWKVEVPSDGIYELKLQQVDKKWLPGHVRICVDGRQAFFARSNYRTRGIPGADGAYRMIRHLKRGTHEIDVSEQFFWPIGTGPKEFLGGRVDRKTGKVDGPRVTVTFGSPEDPAAVAYQFDDREDMVFEQGERSVLKEYRPDGTAVDHVVDTSREGAHTLEVKDADGRTVFGPWAYVVVGKADGNRSEVSGLRSQVLVDRVDCTEGAGGPHKFRDNGTSKLVKSSVGTYRLTGPHGFTGDNKGKLPASDWFAYSLKVEHPMRTHVVKLTLPNDVKRAIPAMSHDPVTGNYNGWIVQAGMGPASGPTSEMKYCVWPNTNWIDVLVYCADGMKGDGFNRDGAVLRMELLEYPGGLPRMEAPKCGFNPDRECGWVGEQTNLGPHERTMPPLWDDGHVVPVTGRNRWAYDWNALFCVWERFGELCSHIGQNWYATPVYSYGMKLAQGRATLLTTPGTDCYSEGDREGAAKPVDLFDRDLFKLMLLEMRKFDVKLVADFMYNRFDEGTIQPQWDAITGCPRRDTVLTANASETARFMSCSAFLNPAHPFVRRRLVDFYDQFAERYGAYASFGGIRTRFWRWWPGCFEGFFWSPNFGYEDWTVAEFGKDTGLVLPPVGADEQAYALRRHELQTKYAAAWTAWRATKCLSLREEQLKAMRRHAPQAKMVYANVSTDQDSFYAGGGIEPDFFRGRDDLGFTSGTVGAQHKEGGVEWNHVDPKNFYAFNVREGKGANPPLEKLLEKKAPKVSYPQGYCNISCTDAHPYQLKEPALALADNNLNRLLYGGSWVLPPLDDGLIAFTRVWRAIPTKDWRRVRTAGGREAPVAVWQAQEGKDTLFFAVNRTDLTRTFSLRFPSATAAVNQVTGESISTSTSDIHLSLPPYLPIYCKLVGCPGIDESKVTFTKEELERAERGYRFLAAMDAKGAKKLVEVQECAGERVVINAGTFGNADLTYTWDQLFAPIRDAYEAGELFAVGEKLDAFNRDHAWWYERFGYPDGFAYPKYAAPAKLPLPIAEFQGIGPFQTVAKTNGQHNIDYYAGTYPPETEGYRPDRTYTGLYGWKVGWKPVRNTVRRVVDLEKAFPECDVVAANDVGFLVTWVYAPDDREATLYKCGDYYLEISLNGEKVLAKGGGPVFGYYDPLPVRLRKGWNEILIRSSPGCTHHWNAGLAIDPFEGLKLSGERP